MSSCPHEHDSIPPRLDGCTVDTLDVSNLPIEFKCLRTIKPEPNKCVLTVYNLSDDHRAQLIKRNQPNQSSKNLVGVPVQIEAGYENNTSVIFSADLREVGSSLADVDWKTTLAGDDGGRSYREARFQNGGITFTAGTPIGTILSQCAQAMGIGLGNSANFTEQAQIAGIGSTLPHTMTLHGNVKSQLDRVINSIGYTWSIQGGALQLMKKGSSLALSNISLSASTGLLGSPEAAIDSTVSLGSPQQFAAGAKQKTAHPPKPKDPSILRAKTLMIPGITPGRGVSLDSKAFRGNYTITEAEAVGSTFGDDWGYNLVLRIAAS